MNYGRVYCVTNKMTGEQYIGQTKRTVKKRWDAHWRTAICQKDRKAKFQHAIAKYGKEAFEVATVYEAFDAVALNDAEIAIISYSAPAYNASRGGKGSRPVEYTDSRRAKLSVAAKLRWANPEWKAKTVGSIKAAHQTPEGIARGHALRAYKGAELRWAGHVKKPKPVHDKAATIRASWSNPEVRAKRVAGLKTAQAKPEVRAKYVAASTGRIIPREAVERSARAKWKPVYCPELQISFLCGKYAAEYFGVVRTSVSNAVRQKGKLLRKYSLELVA